MGQQRAFRDRDDSEAAVLDALVDRPEDGMTVFELRSHAGIGIDDLESALADLDREGLIETERENTKTVIKPDEQVLPDGDETTRPTLLDRLRRRLRKRF